MSGEITAKDGLLWRNGKFIELPEADRVAELHGFMFAERMVKALEGGWNVLEIDLRNAFEAGHNESNFTVLLLRLIAKADSDNKWKLARGFPTEVEAVDIFKNACPYKDEKHTEVDWDEIGRRAREQAKEGV